MTIRRPRAARPATAIALVLILLVPAATALVATTAADSPEAAPSPEGSQGGVVVGPSRLDLFDAIANGTLDAEADLASHMELFERLRAETEWKPPGPDPLDGLGPDAILEAMLPVDAVELAEQRTRTAKVWRVDDEGTHVVRVAAGPLHYLDALGRWQDIETTILPVQSGFANLANSFGTTFHADGTVAYAADAGSVTWTPVGLSTAADDPGAVARAASLVDAPRITVAGDTLVYEGLFGNADDRHHIVRGGVKHDVILRAPPDVTTTGSGTFRVDGTIALSSGLALFAGDEPVTGPTSWPGALTVKDASGQDVFLLSPVVARESPRPDGRAAETTGSYLVEPDGDAFRLSLVVPLDWLLAADRRYPVMVDPTLTDTLTAHLNRVTATRDPFGKDGARDALIGIVIGDGMNVAVGTWTFEECWKVWKWVEEIVGKQKNFYDYAKPWKWRWENIYGMVKRLLLECSWLPDDFRGLSMVTALDRPFQNADRVTDVRHVVSVTDLERSGRMYLMPSMHRSPLWASLHYGSAASYDSRADHVYVSGPGWYQFQPDPEFVEGALAMWSTDRFAEMRYLYDGGVAFADRPGAYEFDAFDNFPEWIITYIEDDDGPETSVDHHTATGRVAPWHPDHGSAHATGWTQDVPQATLWGHDDGTRCTSVRWVDNLTTDPTFAFEERRAPQYFDDSRTETRSQDCRLDVAITGEGYEDVTAWFTDAEGRESGPFTFGFGRDTTPPYLLDVSIEGAPGPNPGWYGDIATYTFTLRDDHAGCESLAVRTTEELSFVEVAAAHGDAITYPAGDCVYRATYQHTDEFVDLQVTDAAGNVGTIRVALQIADSAGPERWFWINDTFQNRWRFQLGGDQWGPFKGEAAFSIGEGPCAPQEGDYYRKSRCDDEGAHLCEDAPYDYRIDEGPWQNNWGHKRSCPQRVVNRDGVHWVEVNSINAGGFTSSYRWPVRVDRYPPQIAFEALGARPPMWLDFVGPRGLYVESFDTASPEIRTWASLYPEGSPRWGNKPLVNRYVDAARPSFVLPPVANGGQYTIWLGSYDSYHETLFGKTITVDAEPPRVHLLLDGAPPAGQTLTSVPVVSVELDGTGTWVTDVRMRINGGPWLPRVLTDADLQQSGGFLVEFEATDFLGNKGYANYSFRLDLEAPRLDVLAADPTDGAAPRVPAASGWSVNPVDLVLACDDGANGTGCRELRHRERAFNWTTDDRIVITEPGMHLIEVEAEDVAGHVTNHTRYAIGYDPVAPIARVEVSCAEGRRWCNGDAFVSGTVSDSPASRIGFMETVYENGFTTRPSTNDTAGVLAPHHVDAYGNGRLGPFDGRKTAILNLSWLPPHDALTVEFDLVVAGNWRGNFVDESGTGPDRFRVYATGGKTAFESTFATSTAETQCFPAPWPCDERVPGRTGALGAFTDLGGLAGDHPDRSTSPDTIYRIVYSTLHSGWETDISFEGNTGTEFVRFAIDNVVVSTETVGANVSSWSCTVNGGPVGCRDVVTLPDGVHVATAAGADALGNTATGAGRIYVDRTAPDVRVQAACMQPGEDGWCVSGNLSMMASVRDAAPLGGVPQLVLDEDFTRGPSAAWSVPEGTPVTTTPGGMAVLGPFAEGELVLHLHDLPAHDTLLLEFDLFTVDGMDGNDPFTVRVNGTGDAFSSTFSNTPGSDQCYPLPHPCATKNPAFTGAHTVHDVLGGSAQDGVYRVAVPLEHTGDAVTFRLRGLADADAPQGQWGIAGVRVLTDVSGIAPGAVACSHRTVAIPCEFTPDVGDGEHTFSVIAEDRAGNRGVAHATLRVDSVPPTVVARWTGDKGAGEWFVGPVNGTFSCADPAPGSGCARIEVGPSDTGPWDLADTVRYEAHGSNAGFVRVTDKAGNQAVTRHEVLIDSRLPSLVVTWDRPATASGWWDGAVEARFSCEDPEPGSGCEQVTASTAPGWWVPIAAYTFAAEGESTLWLRTRDAAGNAQDFNVTAAVDYHWPIAGVVLEGTEGAATGFYRSHVTAHFSCRDPEPGSGCESVAHRPTTTGPWTEGDSKLHANEGWFRGYVRAKDAAGHVGEQSYSGFIDTQPPGILINITGETGNDGAWLSATVSATSHDPGPSSGWATGLQHGPTASGPWTPAQSMTYTSAGEHEGYFRVVDVAGHETIEGYVVVVDATAPAIALAQSPDGSSGWWRGDAVVAVTCTDPAPETGCVATFDAPAAEGPWRLVEQAAANATTRVNVTVTGEGARTHWFKVQDQAGRETTREAHIKIDSISPELSWAIRGTPGENGWYQGPVFIDVTCRESAPGSRCQGDTFPVEEHSHTVYVDTEGITPVTIAVHDWAGHANATTLDIKIDTESPVLNITWNGDPERWSPHPLVAHLSCTDAGVNASCRTLYAEAETGPWTEGSDVHFDGEGHIVRWARAVDASGRTTTRYLEARVDTVPPTARLDMEGQMGDNGWFTGPVDFTLVCEDAAPSSGCAYANHNYWGSWSSLPANTGDAMSPVTFNVVAGDHAGHGVNHEVSIPVDRIPPTVSQMYVTGEGGDPVADPRDANGWYRWYRSPVAVSIDAWDGMWPDLGGSGVREIRVSVDGGDFDVTDTLALDEEGLQFITARAVDHAGLVGENRTDLVGIDLTPPSAHLALAGTVEVDGVRFAGKNTHADCFTEDAGSGVDASRWDTVEVVFDDGGTGWARCTSTLPNVNANHGRSATLTYAAVDRAGHAATSPPVRVVYDGWGPDVEVLLNGVRAPRTVGPGQTLTFAFTDHSGVASSGVIRSWAEDSYLDPAPADAIIVPSEPGQYHVTVWGWDGLGNRGNLTDFSFTVDAQPPTSALMPAGRSALRDVDGESVLFLGANTTLRLTTDDPEAVTEYRLVMDGVAGNWTQGEFVNVPNVSTRFGLEYRARDAAGNVEPTRTHILGVDLDAPRIVIQNPQPGQFWTPFGVVESDADGDGLPDALEPAFGRNASTPDGNASDPWHGEAGRTYVLPGHGLLGERLVLDMWLGEDPVGSGIAIAQITRARPWSPWSPETMALQRDFAEGNVSTPWYEANPDAYVLQPGEANAWIVTFWAEDHVGNRVEETRIIQSLDAAGWPLHPCQFVESGGCDESPPCTLGDMLDNRAGCPLVPANICAPFLVGCPTNSVPAYRHCADGASEAQRGWYDSSIIDCLKPWIGRECGLHVKRQAESQGADRTRAPYCAQDVLANMIGWDRCGDYAYHELQGDPQSDDHLDACIQEATTTPPTLQVPAIATLEDRIPDWVCDHSCKEGPITSLPIPSVIPCRSTDDLSPLVNAWFETCAGSLDPTGVGQSIVP